MSQAEKLDSMIEQDSSIPGSSPDANTLTGKPFQTTSNQQGQTHGAHVDLSEKGQLPVQAIDGGSSAGGSGAGGSGAGGSGAGGSGAGEAVAEKPFNPYSYLLCPKTGEPMITVSLWGEEIEYSEGGWWFDGGPASSYRNGVEPHYELYRLLNEHAQILEVLQNARSGSLHSSLTREINRASGIAHRRTSVRRELEECIYRIKEADDLANNEKEKAGFIKRLTELVLEVQGLEKHSLPVIDLEPGVEPVSNGSSDGGGIACPATQDPMLPVRIYGREIFASEAGLWLEHIDLIGVLERHSEIRKKGTKEAEEVVAWHQKIWRKENTSSPQVPSANQIDVGGIIRETLKHYEEIKIVKEKIAEKSRELYLASSNPSKQDELLRDQSQLHSHLERLQQNFLSRQKAIELTQGWERIISLPVSGPHEAPADANWPSNMIDTPGMLTCPKSGMPMYKVDVDGKGLILDVSTAGVWLDGVKDENTDISSGELGRVLQYEKDATGFWQGTVMGGQQRLAEIKTKIAAVQERQKNLMDWWEETRQIERDQLPQLLIGSPERLKAHERLGQLSKIIIEEYRRISEASKLD